MESYKETKKLVEEEVNKFIEELDLPLGYGIEKVNVTTSYGLTVNKGTRDYRVTEIEKDEKKVKVFEVKDRDASEITAYLPTDCILEKCLEYAFFIENKEVIRESFDRKARNDEIYIGKLRRLRMAIEGKLINS